MGGIYKWPWLLLCALLLVLSWTLIVEASDVPKRLFGNQPYAPTRLEWLEVELNAGLRVNLSEESGFSMDFVPIGNEDTILIYVRYLPSVNRTIMNMSIDAARKVIAIKTKSYGWSGWLKVKENVEMHETNEAGPAGASDRNKTPGR